MVADAPFRTVIDTWLAAYHEVFAVLEAIPPDKRDTPAICGVWSARQIVAHMAGWHYEAVRRFADITAGDPFDRHYDVDAFNALQVEARDHLDWRLTVADLREVVDILRMQALDVPESWATGEPRYAEWLRGLTQDAREHLKQLETLCPAPDIP